jgi:hypothetical protein
MFLSSRHGKEAGDAQMRQSNGVALLGANDPRGATIGIINAAPDDDRQSILTAILTQEKLGRKETVLVLPEPNEAFRRPLDFKEFESTLHNLQTQLVFVLPPESSLARVVRQHQYPVFVSLDNYAQYARQFLKSPSSSPAPDTPSSSSAPEETPAPDATPPAEQPPVAPVAPVAPVVPAPGPPDDDEPTQPTHPRAASPAPPSQPAPLDDENEDDEEEEEIETTARPASPIPLRASLFGRPTTAVSPPRNTAQPEPDAPAPLPPLQTSPSPRPRSPRLRWTLIVLFLVVLLLIGGTIGTLSGVLPVALVFPGITSATVTITPDSKVQQQSYLITAVTTLADSTKRQVQARFLSTTTSSQTKTVAATGNGTYPARHALGELTFYNALPQAQTVPKGTVVTDDQGIQVISDEDALVPPVQPPQEGNAIVPAHALLAGVGGNNFQIAAIRTCCMPGISVASTGAFQGGQDVSTYTYVQQSDIAAAIDALKKTQMNAGQSVLKKQVAPGERLFGSDQCQPDTTSDHAAGDRAQTVTVTVQVTCTGEVYDQQATQQMAEDLLKTDTEAHIGSGYVLANHITTTIHTVQKKDASGTLQLQVSASGLWSYQFAAAQMTSFAHLIAGLKADQAVTTLSQQPGVHHVSVNLFLAYDNTLPGDPHQITMVLQPSS